MAEDAPPPPGPAALAAPAGMGRARSIVVWALVGAATLLLLASSLTIFVKRAVLDADNWADTSVQLLEDDEIRGALATYLVDQVYDNVDVAAQLRQRLPQQLQGLAAPAAAGLHQLGVQAADALLARPRVQELWRTLNRRAVRSFVAILEGEEVRRLRAEQGQVVLDLQPLVRNVAARVGVSNRLPPDAGRLVLLESDQLDAAQDGLNALRVLTVFLAIVVLALYVAAVVLARGARRRVLLGVGLCLVAAGIVLLAARRVAGNGLVDALSDDILNRPAALRAWDIGTELLRDLAIAGIVYGLLLVLAALLSGPSRPAVATRRALAPILRRYPVPVFAAVLLVFFLVILWGPSAGGRGLWGSLVLLALLLIGVETLRRQVRREFPADSAA